METAKIFFYSLVIFPGVVLVLSALLVLAERFLVDQGPFEIDINREVQFNAPGGVTLLQALYDSEIFIPSACGGQATCGHCKVTVKEGGGDVLSTELSFVGRKEREEGVRLACQIKLKQKLQIEVPAMYLDVQEYQAVVKSTRDVTPDIKEIRFSLIEPKEIEFRPGQYIQVKCPDPDGDFVFRAYSLSSKASDKTEAELNVRIVPGGIGSTYLHSLEVGDPVTFTGPFGEFELDQDEDTEIVCVGGGCGMAPMKSILQTLFEENPNRTAWFFFGCRGTADIFYLDDYKEMEKKYPGFHVVYALSDMQPGEQWDGEKGFIHISVDRYLDRGGKRQAFLCGPPPMINAVMEVFEDKELPDDRIFYDKF